jgi:hypothetical protein
MIEQVVLSRCCLKISPNLATGTDLIVCDDATDEIRGRLLHTESRAHPTHA